MSTKLDPHTRGDTFDRSVPLLGDWLCADFTGGFKFTLRRSIPSSSTIDDTGAVDQASTETDDITCEEATCTVAFSAARTTAWPTRTLVWDLQGVITGETEDDEDVVYTIDSGTILIVGDVTRST